LVGQYLDDGLPVVACHASGKPRRKSGILKKRKI
jgi:hypothetical protein